MFYCHHTILYTRCCLYTRVYTLVYIHVYIHMCTHVTPHLCTCACKHVCIYFSTQVSKNQYTHVYTHQYTHLYTHVYKHFCTLVRTHVYTRLHPVVRPCPRTKKEPQCHQIPRPPLHCTSPRTKCKVTMWKPTTPQPPTTLPTTKLDLSNSGELPKTPVPDSLPWTWIWTRNQASPPHSVRSAATLHSGPTGGSLSQTHSRDTKCRNRQLPAQLIGLLQSGRPDWL